MAPIRIALLPLLLALATVHTTQGASPDDWRGRTIYQIITDRFAIGSSTLRSNTDGSLSVESADPALPACAQQETYCGGNFEGIIEHLDYIQNMGFDAIWISPIPENFPNSYHGYGAKNIYEINSHFGGSQGLYNLVQACHERGMYVMVDVVGNHMGIPPNYDWTQLYPFNQSSHFHGCSSCPSNCWINDFTNQNQVEICRLDGLPDLDQSNPFVASTLLNWISSLVSEFGIDGLRIDTVAEVHPTFWDQFQKAAGIYAVGEVFNGDVGYVSSYQQHLDALLSYPLYFAMTSVFGQKNSMSNIANLIPSYSSKFKDINLLGTFIDNHDNPRFLNVNGDTQAYKNALVYTLMSTGIPIVYYGTEQGYSGGDTPHNRLPLWLSGFSTSTDLYKFLSTVIKFRKDNQVWTYPQVQRYADDNFYAFTRGNVFVATTNVGSGGNTQTRTITYHPYQDGTVLCNLFWGNDCVTVASGKFTVSLQNGEVKIYSPSSKH